MSDSQVRSVTAVLKADCTVYDKALAQSATVTKKSAEQMSTAVRSAATQVEASAKKMSTAEKQAAQDIQKAAAAAEKAATREAAAVEKAATREVAAAKKAAATVEREQAKQAAAVERAAAKEEAATRKATAVAEREQAKKAVAAERSAARGEAAARKMAAVESAAYREQAAVAAVAAKSAEHATSQRHAAMTDLGTTLGVTSAVVLAATGLAIKGYANFESQMSRVGAAMDATAPAMDRLKVAALDAGQATKYSATEAAVAEEELGKAGLSVSEIVGGGLTASMNLAAAGNMELGESAEIAATTMKTFGMAAAEVPKVADALAAGAGKAVGSVHELGYALKMSGLVASQLGMSMTDTVGTLSAFAQNALKGSDAGTSLKSMLTFLQPKSDAAATAMEDLGLKFYDAQGKFIGITGVAGQLQSKLSGLTDEQRMSTMTTIFGTDAIRAANILYREGAGGIQKWIDAVEDQGYAARVAALSQQNLKGDIEKLGGAIETALITSGGGGAAGLRHLTQAATATVNAFGALPSPVSNTVTVVGLVAGVAGLAAAGFLKVRASIWETRASMAAMNVTATSARSRLGGIAGFLGGPFGAALTVGTLALGTWITRQQDAAEASQALRIALDQQTGAMTKNAQQVIQDALAADQPKSNFLPNWAFPGGDTSSINVRARELGISLHDVQLAAEGSAPALAKVRAQLEPRMAAAFESRDINQAEKMRSVLDFLADSSSDVGKQRQALLMSKDAMTELGGAAGDAGAGVAGYADATGEATAETDAMVKAQEELASALDASNNKFLAGRAAERDYQASLDDAAAALKGVTEAEKHNGKALDEHSAKGRKNQEVLDGLASTSLARLQAVLSDEGPGRKFEQTLASTRAELIRVAHRFGMTKTAAKEYAAKVLDIPKKAMTDIRLKNAEKAKRQADELYSAVRSLPRYKTITLTVKQVFENYGGESAAKGRYAASGLLHRATGGQIPADAGTPGKDSVHALLSPGEYVVNRKATRAHLPLLEAINTGRLPGYATGGQVGARAASTVTVTAPQVVMVPVQETHTTAATVHVGTVYTRDAQSFLGWGQRRSFDATAGIH